MSFFDSELEAELARLERDSLRRHLRVVESAHDPWVLVDGRRMLMLASNNYLGLASHPEIARAAQDAIGKYGVGAGASRLIAGSIAPLHELEREIASWKGLGSALVFGSGYLANLGVITAIAGSEDVVFSDELNHASLIDGCRLSRARVLVYRHRDVDHLASLLGESRAARRRIVVTDSVFSMDGDLAPLGEIVEVARRHRAIVMIDEAHGVGVLGAAGAGLAAQLGLEREIDVHVGTLSKALGAYGAYVAGSRALTDYLLNRSRSFIYSTGLAPAMAAASRAAIGLLRAEPGRIARLWENASYLRAALERIGFAIAPTETPILPVIVGESADAVALAAKLMERGVYVVAIRPPTVPRGTARLRVTPTAAHSRADLDFAIAAFEEAIREMRPVAMKPTSRSGV